MADATLFLFAVIVTSLLLFSTVWFIILYSDLECDFLNPIDLCTRVNQWIVPDMALHAFMVIVFLLSGSWTAMIINLPLLGWNANRIHKRTHILDATEIFRVYQDRKKECFIKLGFYIISFFYYLYRMIFGILD